DEGIYFSSSNYNILTNITLSSNGYYGIRLRGNNNTIKDSVIEGNQDYGILMFGTVTEPNYFYNNIINNTNNVYLSGTIYANMWNTTEQLKTNIIGGSYFGGNFWTNPSGTGFSNTCTDINPSAGICDDAYNITTDSACTPGVNCGINTDYLPLTKETCQAVGYVCCDPVPGCKGTGHPFYDDTCSGQICCEMCETPLPTIHFNGVIDNVVIYNRALGSGEIRNHYLFTEQTMFHVIEVVLSLGYVYD
ncbi:MAG: hypothetical protein JSW41_02890, partial [Candidatus Aenigmatarchaeota archaeon]